MRDGCKEKWKWKRSRGVRWGFLNCHLGIPCAVSEAVGESCDSVDYGNDGKRRVDTGDGVSNDLAYAATLAMRNWPNDMCILLIITAEIV
jgi:hypothetical protein